MSLMLRARSCVERDELCTPRFCYENRTISFSVIGLLPNRLNQRVLVSMVQSNVSVFEVKGAALAGGALQSKASGTTIWG
jgi:hypothetical protein